MLLHFLITYSLMMATLRSRNMYLLYICCNKSCVSKAYVLLNAY